MGSLFFILGNMTPQIHDQLISFHDGLDTSSQLTIERTQEITTDFLDALAEKRKASSGAPMGNFHQVASIPTILYEQWLREGYDISREPISKTVARLKAESLDYFLTTDKRI